MKSTPEEILIKLTRGLETLKTPYKNIEVSSEEETVTVSTFYNFKFMQVKFKIASLTDKMSCQVVMEETVQCSKMDLATLFFDVVENSGLSEVRRASTV